MTLSPNIILGNDYVTAYFADQIWPRTLKDHRKRWDEAAKAGEPSPRSRLSGLSTTYFRTKPDAADGDTDALDALCGQVTDALGYPADFDVLGQPQPATVTLGRGDDIRALPCLAAVTDGDDHPVLVAVATDTFTTDPNTLVTSDAKPRHRLHRLGQPDATVDGTDTVPGLANEIFASEHPPRWILVVSGGAVALLDHKPWIDGKWLGADLDDILSNNDRTSGGELDQLAGWFSNAGTIPDEDGTSLLDAAVDGSQRQAVGVSESLRDAVRAGVEAIANEVLYDRRERRKLSVFGEQGGVTIDAADLARQAIRWMYRLVVLLYAEARPGIGILPTTNDGTTLYEGYEAGYGLDRLRQLALVDLETEAARNGTHIHQSLNVLFRLVNEGHHRPVNVELNAEGGDTWTGIEFSGLNSRLFGPKSCPDIDVAQLRDHVLQKVIAGMCFTPGEKGKGRQAVSYANLEVNQLGAVYEGLMAYTGFIALEDRNEVAARTKGDDNNGVARSADPSRGSWTIPVAAADRYPDNVFVTEKDEETGETRRVVHEKGSFVFRLAGRDRARSASFYTPSVLTEFTVRHALEEWQANHPDLAAADVLQMTILEPALGSGAFANEACDQAAELYLRLREAETGETVPAEDRPTELRKLRAHFAINQTYGVDLNDTGVELAEVSLWLNSMHPGLAAPPLSHRLRRGNSLIGCTRSTYTEDQVARQPWKGDVFPPTDKPLAEHPLGTQGLGIHHFLLPGEGWGAAAKTGKGNPCRELAPDWCDAVWDWKKEIHKKPNKAQIARAKQIANKIEALWAAAAADVESHLNAQNRRIAIWSDPGTTLPAGDSTRFRDPSGPYQRLKTIMDAWCALWLWAPRQGTALPALDQWLDCIDYLCGERRSDAEGRLFGEHTTIAVPTADDSAALFETEISYSDATTIDEAIERWPWIGHCRAIAQEQGFFHWDVDFAPVLGTGGFGLQVGNPPWVRPTWDEPASLAEHDPWWGVTDLKSAGESRKSERRARTLESPRAVTALLAEAAENLGVNSLLGSETRESLLSGIQTNLYLNFLTGTLRRIARFGTAGLLHPESHFVDPKAGPLRSATYGCLRRHWQFVNLRQVFTDVSATREYGVNIYSVASLSPRFSQAVNLLHPALVDASLGHDGDGEVPGMRYADGDWDMRPHRSRIYTVDSVVLQNWNRLFGDPGSDWSTARLLRPLTSLDAQVLDKYAQVRGRVTDEDRRWTSGLHEKGAKTDGIIRWETAVPATIEECVLQGPHLVNFNCFGQEPRVVVKSTHDWDPVNVETLPSDYIPRTNYLPGAGVSSLHGAQATWSGVPSPGYLREIHREYVDPLTPRTLQSGLLPPGPSTVHSLVSMALGDDAGTVRWSGLLSSLPYDYLVKVSGNSHIKKYVTDALPWPGRVPMLEPGLTLRVMRLNAVSASFSTSWESLFESRWQDDSFVLPGVGVNLGAVTETWTRVSALRQDLSRWAAEVEVDALVAHLLGIAEDELAQMYRSQFHRLRRYESAMVFDANGHKVASDVNAKSRMQLDSEGTLEGREGRTFRPLWERVEAYRDGDTNIDLAHLVAPFRRADRELAMRTAYRAFAERSGRTDGVSTEPLPEWEVWG